jgi:hypothetical protein
MDFVIGEPAHETLAASCPKCGHHNIKSRKDDLKTERAIARAQIKCEACQHPFAIGGDLVNPRHEQLLYDVAPCLQRKEYAEAVQKVSRAYEIFFGRALRIQLVLRPFARGFENLTDERDLQELLQEKIGRCPFEPLRSLFLKMVVEQVAPKDVADAKAEIAKIPDDPDDIRGVKKKTIKAVTDPKIRDLLLGLQKTEIHVLRNKVMHKDAYRPSREEAERAHNEGWRLLFNLGLHLDLQGHDEYYVNGGGRT